MVQYDLNKVYVGETEQDVFLKKPNTSDMADSQIAKITMTNTCILILEKRNDHLHCRSSNIYFL